MKVKNQKGFTLAELLIVMAIIVVLAAVAIPTFGRQLETSRETTDIENVRNAYTDAMAIAMLDFADGKLDGKKNGVANSLTGATITPGTDDDENKKATYQMTIPALTGSGWTYVNNKIAGRTAGDPTKGHTKVSFIFVVTGDVLELAAQDDNPITFTA